MQNSENKLVEVDSVSGGEPNVSMASTDDSVQDTRDTNNIISNQISEQEKLENANKQKEIASLIVFCKTLKDKVNILLQKENIRVTHKGLLIKQEFSEEIIKFYLSWLEEQTSGEIHKSNEKARKKLFGDLKPESFYIQEGKLTITGYLIGFESSDLRQFGLPFYQGPVSSKKSFIHAGDSVFKDLKDFTLKNDIDGTGVSFKLANKNIQVSSKLLSYFLLVAKNSIKIQKEYPDLEDNLAVQIRALVIMLRKSKPINSERLILIPKRYAKFNDFNINKNYRYEFRIIGNVVFVIDSKNSLCDVYGIAGRDLHRLIRREFLNIKSGRIGSFEIYRDKNINFKIIGEFRFSRIRYELSIQSFIDFLVNLSLSPTKADLLKGDLTVEKVFTRFSENFQMAVPIEQHLIKSHLKLFKRPIKETRINGVWIFVLNQANLIEACVPKFI